MDEPEDIQWVQWIGLVDILGKHNYVCERDWKDELDDFLYFLQELHGMKANPLPIERNWLDEQGDIVEWCRNLDDAWASQNMCVAAMDIESDSYVLFPCKTAVLERLQQWAGQMGRRIDSAKNM